MRAEEAIKILQMSKQALFQLRERGVIKANKVAGRWDYDDLDVAHYAKCKALGIKYTSYSAEQVDIPNIDFELDKELQDKLDKVTEFLMEDGTGEGASARFVAKALNPIFQTTEEKLEKYVVIHHPEW